MPKRVKKVSQKVFGVNMFQSRNLSPDFPESAGVEPSILAPPLIWVLTQLETDVEPPEHKRMTLFEDLQASVTTPCPTNTQEALRLYRALHLASTLGSDTANFAVETILEQRLWERGKYTATRSLGISTDIEDHVIRTVLTAHYQGDIGLLPRNRALLLGQHGVHASYAGREDEEVCRTIGSAIDIFDDQHLLADSAQYRRQLAIHCEKQGQIAKAARICEQAIRDADNATEIPQMPMDNILYLRGVGGRGLLAHLNFRLAEQEFHDQIPTAKWSHIFSLFEEGERLSPENLRAKGLSGFQYNQALIRHAEQQGDISALALVQTRALHALKLTGDENLGGYDRGLAELILAWVAFHNSNFAEARTQLEQAETSFASVNRNDQQKIIIELQNKLKHKQN